jgi:hypothetical protein
MANASLERRLAALEAARDTRLNALWDRFYAREREVLGDRWPHYNDTLYDGQAADPELVRLVETDPQIRAIWRVIWAVEAWRNTVEHYTQATRHTRSGR